MGDLEKITNFRCKITDKDEDYINCLKSLLHISDEAKKIMLRVIEKYQKEHSVQSSGYIESELIRRFLSPSAFLELRVEKIEGPVSIYQMSHPEYPHIFYLFGDVHMKWSVCPNTYDIGQWLKDTVINSPVFIDIYVETPYYYKKYITQEMGKKKDEYYLKDTASLFEDCFLKKSNPECLTSRFHYSDMRFIFENETQQKVFNILRNQHKLVYVTSENIEELNEYIRFLQDENSFVNLRIKKQLDNIENPSIRKILEQSFEKCKKKYMEKIFLINIDNNSEYSKYNPSQIDLRSTSPIFCYVVCLMDYYLMGRCFRSYKKDAKYSRPSYNNIIYAGEAHINIYIDILLKLGFVIDFKDLAKMSFDMWDLAPPRDKSQCLDVSKMKQPMFHQRYK
jgi:hypothetical protein